MTLIETVVRSIHIGALEAIWLALNTSTLILAIVAYVDAKADARNVKALNGHAREIAASGNVRRELIRVGVQSLLVGVTIPGIFNDREVQLTLPVLFLMILPLLLLTNSYLDARDRKAITVVIATDLHHERDASYARIEAATERILSAVAVNTDLARQASDRAEAIAADATVAMATVDDRVDVDHLVVGVLDGDAQGH